MNSKQKKVARENACAWMRDADAGTGAASRGCGHTADKFKIRKKIIFRNILKDLYFFSPTSENHVKLLPPNTYKKTFVLSLKGEPRNSSRALHRGTERDYFMSS